VVRRNISVSRILKTGLMLHLVVQHVASEFRREQFPEFGPLKRI